MSDDAAVSFETVLDEERAAIARARQRRRWPGGPPREDKASDTVGLAFSGGGIRSATFNLGVLQGLAELKLLRRFDYLSTVSGGGYIGSWLAAWFKKADDFDTVEQQLSPRWTNHPNGEEAPPVQFLRRYSNYLTPRVGLFGADTWTAISNYLRNLLLNQSILIAALSALLILPRLVMRAFPYDARGSLVGLPTSLALVGLGFAFIVLAIAFVGLNLLDLDDGSSGTPHIDRWYAQQGVIQWLVIVPTFLAAWCANSWLWCNAASHLQSVGSGPSVWAATTAFLYTVLWALGWGLGLLLRRTLGGVSASNDAANRSAIAWQALTVVISALVAGAVGGWLLYLLRDLFVTWHYYEAHAWAAVTWGQPLVLTVFTVILVLHIGLMGTSISDESREWWSRLGGWTLIYLIMWTAVFGLAIYGPYATAQTVYWAGKTWGPWIKSTAAVAWLFSTIGGVLAGRSASTGEKRGSNSTLEWIAALGPYVFIIGLLLMLSLGIQAALGHFIGWADVSLAVLADSSWDLAWRTFHDIASIPMWHFSTSPDILALVACIVVTLGLSWRVDINHFSLNVFYRDRLVRCYLGASNGQRDPNPFTGFDPDDDPVLADFYKNCDQPPGTTASPQKAYPGPYPLINAALNLTAGEDLAWQQRKAASFVFTPLFSGFEIATNSSGTKAAHGYRPMRSCPPGGEELYGGGVTLGTAMAISGAAASPNMGYHSSPPLAFLLTLFNVRLGWWLSNPKQKKWTKAGPQLGLGYLLKELFGSTNEHSNYVYLSDGGHFDNLGLYELVRRRCRYVVVCDAGEDGECKFADLGTAIRLCRTDFGVDIEINVDAIRKQASTSRSLWHCAVGTIHYEHSNQGDAPGTLVYIKPSLTGSEPSDVLNYAAANPAFPHQSTADQFFDESQFESYRALGHHIGKAVFEPVTGDAQTETLFVKLRQTWYPPSVATPDAFTKLTNRVDAMVERLRKDPALQFLDAQIYPQWEVLTQADARPTQLWLPSTYDEIRNGFYFCRELIQLMEDVYLDLRLDTEYAHPDNRGWMNLFKHWVWCGMVRATWAMCASTYGARFQNFCEQRLDLKIGDVVIAEATSPIIPELNAVEIELIRHLPKPGATRRIFLLQIKVQAPPDDPSRDTNKPPATRASTKAAMHLTFGFAIVDAAKSAQIGELAYFRVQDHLRRMGLGRRALRELIKTSHLTEKHIALVSVPPEAPEAPSERDRAHFERFFKSVTRETPD